jgi:hypothetical protein
MKTKKYLKKKIMLSYAFITVVALILLFMIGTTVSAQLMLDDLEDRLTHTDDCPANPINGRTGPCTCGASNNNDLPPIQPAPDIGGDSQYSPPDQYIGPDIEPPDIQYVDPDQNYDDLLPGDIVVITPDDQDSTPPYPDSDSGNEVFPPSNIDSPTEMDYTGDDHTNPAPPAISTDRIPNATLPAAAGASAIILALGALGAASANGIPPHEAIGELKTLFGFNQVLLQGNPPDAAGYETPPLPEDYPPAPTIYNYDPAEAHYREQVRLLQEDIKRQRELLDREKQRLEEYRKAGLNELLAGTEARIREHETLAELNRKELTRLGEQIPEHQKISHTDLASHAADRVENREIINELNRSEAVVEEIRRPYELEATREEVTRKAEKMVEQNMNELEKHMQEVIDQKSKEGYYVRNSNLLKKAWNNSIGRVVNECVGGYKGGQCGEYGQWGMDWSKDAVREIFGEKAIITDISASNNRFLGHRATKVILPDGRRIVLDYWEGMPEGKPKIYSEEEWIKKWDKKLWGDYLGKAQVDRHPDELNLKQYITDWGEEKGIEKFRTYQSNKNGLEYADIFIRSWERSPW